MIATESVIHAVKVYFIELIPVYFVASEADQRTQRFIELLRGGFCFRKISITIAAEIYAITKVINQFVKKDSMRN